MDAAPFAYDVAVSFAGEQRPYVEAYVEACTACDVRVFYDRDVQVAMWGRNLICELRRVYGGRAARLFVPFFSADYLAKPFPRDEYAAAVEQQFHRNGQAYVLPVVFGNVVIPPELLNPAIGRLRAEDFPPRQLAELTARRR